MSALSPANNADSEKHYSPNLTDEDKSDILLSHKYRLALPAKPSQSNFRVLALLFYEELVGDKINSSEQSESSRVSYHLPPWVRHEDTQTSRTFIVGSNDEPGYIGGSICAERAAMVQLRFVPSFRLTKIVISTDATTEAVPCGQLCREYLAGHGRSVPMNLPIISTGSRCRRCGVQDDDLFTGCINGHSDHSLPILQTTLGDLYPYPSPYTRLSASQSLLLGKSVHEQHTLDKEDSRLRLVDERAKRLLQLAISKAKKAMTDEIANFGHPLHPIQFGAAALFEDGSIVTTNQSSALEYGCTLDAVSQLASHIEQKQPTCGRPTFIVQADQYGIAHAPFAPARAWLSERGYGDVRLLVHHFVNNEEGYDASVVANDDAIVNVQDLRLEEVTVFSVAPNPPTWNSAVDSDTR